MTDLKQTRSVCPPAQNGYIKVMIMDTLCPDLIIPDVLNPKRQDRVFTFFLCLINTRSTGDHEQDA